MRIKRIVRIGTEPYGPGRELELLELLPAERIRQLEADEVLDGFTAILDAPASPIPPAGISHEMTPAPGAAAQDGATSPATAPAGPDAPTTPAVPATDPPAGAPAASTTAPATPAAAAPKPAKGKPAGKAKASTTTKAHAK